MTIRGSATSRRNHAAKPLMERRQTPLYSRLKCAIRERILRGDLVPGQPTPSEAMLRAEFGVSSTTARRCLNDLELDGYVQRVQGQGTFVCERDALKSARHIGIFYHDLVNLTSTFAASVLKGIFDQVGQSRFQPELLSSAAVRKSPNPSAAMAEMLRQRSVEGLLVLSPTPALWLKDVLASRLPVVSVNMEYEDARVYGVISEARLVMERLLDEIIARGHRRMVAMREVLPEKLEGLLSSRIPELSRSPLRCHFETLSYYSPAQARAIVEKHLVETEPATVFLAYGYELALEVGHILKSLGFNIPADVSLIYFGVSPGPSELYQVAVPAALVGGEATRMLSTLLAGHVPLERVVRIPSQIVPGETLGPAQSSVNSNQ
ncbi:MAG: GntR family transcriptional regulator [Verrucomicrobia bacterium]|nr:GntR family transcriptional regulator [Verrucomicrobiota bacterium]